MNLFRQFAFVLVLLVSSVAHAHLKKGTYAGALADGSACSFEVRDVRYANGLPHPLNERAEISAQGKTWVLAHPPLLDTEAGLVLFDHDRLVGTEGVSGGGVAAVLRMSHEDGMDGPVSLTVLRHDYRDPSKNVRSICSKLAHVEE